MTTLSTLALLLPLTGGFGGNKPDCATCESPRPMMPMPQGPYIHAQRNCPPMGDPAQVLATKVVVPAGVRVTAYPGTPGTKTFDGSALFGLRPGYVYRFELAGSFGTLYPEVEVRGTLYLRPGMKLMEHYAAIAYSDRDLERAAAGGIITKVIYLEDPEKAFPVKTTADRPYEIPEDNETEAVKAAMENGRLVMVVRLGNRKPTAEELGRLSVPGTILLPGENHLAAPTSPPTLGWQGLPLFDPLLGPKFPHEECLTDGGDTAARLGVRDDGKLGGLSPTDTSFEFKVGDKKRVVTSNTVCICAPRFVSRRVEQGLGGYSTAMRINVGAVNTPPAILVLKTTPYLLQGREKPMGLLALVHTQLQRGTQGTDVVSGTQGTRAVYQVNAVRVAVGTTEPEEVQDSDTFLLTKEVDPKANVKVGDEVTFTLRYTNRTNKPATDLVLSDSLSGRLEYIPGTTQSDRPTNVTATPNEAGSVVLRFELPGTLQPGQGGVIKFKAKVR